MKAKWEKQIIKIRSRIHKRKVSVEGERWKEFAVHLTTLSLKTGWMLAKDQWSLTHAPTGLRIATYTTNKAAKDAAVRVDKYCTEHSLSFCKFDAFTIKNQNDILLLL